MPDGVKLTVQDVIRVVIVTVEIPASVLVTASDAEYNAVYAEMGASLRVQLDAIRARERAGTPAAIEQPTRLTPAEQEPKP